MWRGEGWDRGSLLRTFDRFFVRGLRSVRGVRCVGGRFGKVKGDGREGW